MVGIYPVECPSYNKMKTLQEITQTRVKIVWFSLFWPYSLQDTSYMRVEQLFQNANVPLAGSIFDNKSAGCHYGWKTTGASGCTLPMSLIQCLVILTVQNPSNPLQYITQAMRQHLFLILSTLFLIPNTLNQNTWSRPALVERQIRGGGMSTFHFAAPPGPRLAGQATMYVGCPPCMASPPCSWLPRHVFWSRVSDRRNQVHVWGIRC